MTARRCYQCGRVTERPIIKNCPGPEHGLWGQNYWRCRHCLVLNDIREEKEHATPK